MPHEEIPCNFVGQFKVGDNLVFNSNILCQLMEANADGSLNKLIVLQIGALLEASLSQIIYRAQNYNREGVPHISEPDRREIQGKKIDKFASVIDVLRKYSILDGLRADIYDDLHRLRKYRNKIHIQDDVNIPNAPRDDDVLFSDDLRDWSIALNSEVLRYVSQHLHRPPHIDGFVNPLRIPSSHACS